MDETNSLGDEARAVDRALSLLAEQPHRNIVLALWERPNKAATLAELRELTGLDGDRLADHLERLRGTLVYEIDEGYKLLPTANVLCMKTRAYAVEDPPSIEDYPLESECQNCHGSLEGSYDDGVVAIRCPSCGSVFYHLAFPAREVAARSPPDLFKAFERRTRRFLSLATDGVCMWCSGPMTTEIVDAADTEESAIDLSVWVHHECQRCNSYIDTTVGENVLDHPAVVSFHHEHGWPIAEVPCWELPFCMTDEGVTIRLRDPWRIELTIAREGARLTVILDEELTIVETNRGQ